MHTALELAPASCLLPSLLLNIASIISIELRNFTSRSKVESVGRMEGNESWEICLHQSTSLVEADVKWSEDRTLTLDGPAAVGGAAALSASPRVRL